jgi:ribosomal protein L20A (L18A)
MAGGIIITLPPTSSNFAKDLKHMRETIYVENLLALLMLKKRLRQRTVHIRHVRLNPVLMSCDSRLERIKESQIDHLLQEKKKINIEEIECFV